MDSPYPPDAGGPQCRAGNLKPVRIEPRKWSILYRLRSVDRRTLATIESPSQGDRAFPPTWQSGTHPGFRDIRAEAGRAKGSAMHAPLYDRRFSSIAMDDCPVCWGKIALAVVEPHPVHEGREIHTYTCEKCGPTKSRIVVCPSNAAALQVAA